MPGRSSPGMPSGRSRMRRRRRSPRGSAASSSRLTSTPTSMLPKKRKPSARGLLEGRVTALIFGWSGATPERTRPHGVARRSKTSTVHHEVLRAQQLPGGVGAGGAGPDDGDAKGEGFHMPWRGAE